MSDRKILIIAMLALVVVVVGGGIGLQAWRTGQDPKAVAAPAYSEPPVTVSDGEPLRLGSSSAPVKATLYEDFHCPHCADFEAEFGPTLTTAQEQGRVQLELYPMAFIDQGSSAAANAMACAAGAGFGPGYYLGLFANHTLRWNDGQLLDLADQVGGAATPAFRTCVTGKAKASWVESINAAADRNGVRGTPTMFLDGRSVDILSLTPETLDRMITEAEHK